MPVVGFGKTLRLNAARCGAFFSSSIEVVCCSSFADPVVVVSAACGVILRIEVPPQFFTVTSTSADQLMDEPEMILSWYCPETVASYVGELAPEMSLPSTFHW